MPSIAEWIGDLAAIAGDSLRLPACSRYRVEAHLHGVGPARIEVPQIAHEISDVEHPLIRVLVTGGQYFHRVHWTDALQRKRAVHIVARVVRTAAQRCIRQRKVRRNGAYEPRPFEHAGEIRRFAYALAGRARPGDRNFVVTISGYRAVGLDFAHQDQVTACLVLDILEAALLEGHRRLAVAARLACDAGVYGITTGARG